MYIGIFVLTYLLNCTVMYFVLKSKHDHQVAEITADSEMVADSLVQLTADSLVQIDSLAVLKEPEVVEEEPVVIDTALLAEGMVPEVDSVEITDYNKRVSRMVRIIDKMKPAKSASVMARLEDEFVIQVLLRMKARNAAKVMSVMPAARAARLSKMMTEKMNG